MEIRFTHINGLAAATLILYNVFCEHFKPFVYFIIIITKKKKQYSTRFNEKIAKFSRQVYFLRITALTSVCVVVSYA